MGSAEYILSCVVYTGINCFIKYLVIFLLLPAGVSAQFSFTIKGHGRSLKEGDKIFLSYKQNNTSILDSVAVKNGSFEFRGIATHVVRGYVCRNDNPSTAYFPL